VFAVVIVIGGVSGVGKTLLGNLLARELAFPFYDADDFHSHESIEKMGSGIQLTDKDREPWLRRLREFIGQCLATNTDAVLACSALKKRYRDVLRVNRQVKLVFLRGDYFVIAAQLKGRRGHFMDPNLLDTQFADLEEPEPDECAIIVQVGRAPRELLDEILPQLRRR
jgi:carbohydrate kinase (thermoresistant glucokinase family)